jgi:spore coat polysaccharide biosynthesis protein SpsF
MKVVAILQARMSSTRLPGKMLLPLAGAPLVQRVIERVRLATRIHDVVLAVPSRDAVAFAPLASRRAWLHPDPGDEADLVGRYLRAAMVHDVDVIVRIPCDNPCLDPCYIDAAIEEYLTYPFVYYSNTTDVAEVGSKLRIDRKSVV